MNALIYNPYCFSNFYADRALSLANGGQKDQARDWLRFFINSDIPAIVARYEGPLSVDKALLFQKIHKLGNACHPLETADHSTQFAALNTKLDGLASGVNLLVKSLPDCKNCRATRKRK